MKNPAISVITPIYNVRPFVAKCAESLLNQTFNDVEYIFVDDASTDGSIQILNGILSRYPERDVKIICHEKNQGLPASRRTGLAAASGDYILNCDGDDWVDTTMLEKLYSAVMSNNADYAYCDFYLSYEHTERYQKSPQFATPLDALKIGYLGGRAKYNVWNKLIKRSLYDGVEFPVEHRKGGEDMIMFDVLSKAKSVAYVPEALYHYVKYNENAISERFSEQRLIDIRYNADQAIAAVIKNCPVDLSKEIAFFKLNVKLPFLITDNPEKWRIWKEWYPEANEFIMANHYLPFRTRLLQWFASKNFWWLVRVYYLLFYRMLYNLLYR